MRRGIGFASVSILLLVAVLPASAQGPGGGGGPPRYMGVSLGAHVGIDYLFEGFLIGGQGIFQIDPWGFVQLMPNAELEFRQGIRDWQANADASVSPVRGIYLGGGVAYRNSIFEEADGRETRRGSSVFVGYRDRAAPRRINPQVELRWTFVADIRPRMLTIGVNYPVLLFR